jgi:hypothetical protein
MAVQKPKPVVMNKVKTTGGAVMFLAEDETLPITNLYLRKASLDKLGLDINTDTIKVTVEKG